MTTITMTFDPYEDGEALAAALHGAEYRDKLDEVYTQCFRPAFKHGYADPKLQALIDGEHGEAILAAIKILTKIYHEVKE